MNQGNVVPTDVRSTPRPAELPTRDRAETGRVAIDLVRQAVLDRVVRSSNERLAGGVLTVRVEGGGE